MRGHSGKKFAQKSRNKLLSERWGDERTRTVDAGPKCAQSWNQIQTLKECLCFHIYCAHLGTPWYSQSHLGWHSRMLFQSSKLKARSSLFTKTWQKRRSSFELWAFENVTPSGIGRRSPKEFSGCLKIPWGFRAQQSWTHLARILELRYSNITWIWKRSLILETHCVLKIFSNPRRVKNSPATGVRFSTRPQDRVQNGEIPRYKRWANLLCQILVPFLGQLRKAMQADDCEDASQPSSPAAASASQSCSWIFRFFRLSRPPIGWRGYMPAHQHCDLFYPLVGDLIESTIN